MASSGRNEVVLTSSSSSVFAFVFVLGHVKEEVEEGFFHTTRLSCVMEVLLFVLSNGKMTTCNKSTGVLVDACMFVCISIWLCIILGKQVAAQLAL